MLAPLSGPSKCEIKKNNTKQKPATATPEQPISAPNLDTDRKTVVDFKEVLRTTIQPLRPQFIKLILKLHSFQRVSHRGVPAANHQ